MEGSVAILRREEHIWGISKSTDKKDRQGMTKRRGEGMGEPLRREEGEGRRYSEHSEYRGTHMGQKSRR